MWVSRYNFACIRGGLKPLPSMLHEDANNLARCRGITKEHKVGAMDDENRPMMDAGDDIEVLIKMSLQQSAMDNQLPSG